MDKAKFRKSKSKLQSTKSKNQSTRIKKGSGGNQDYEEKARFGKRGSKATF
jgi:hypothetical protein